MKKFLISLVISLFVCGNVFAAGQAALRPADLENQLVQSVRVTAGSQLVIAGNGVYLGCDFMVTSADDEVAIVDAKTLVLGQTVLLTSDKVLLDKRQATAKGIISDLAPVGGVPFYNGLVVLLTDNAVDGVVRFKRGY